MKNRKKLKDLTSATKVNLEKLDENSRKQNNKKSTLNSKINTVKKELKAI